MIACLIQNRDNERMSKITNSILAFLVLISVIVVGTYFFLSSRPDSQNTPTTEKQIGDVKRGDIVLFTVPPAAGCPDGTECNFVKRVIGIPGDRVAIKNNATFLNGQELSEPYLAPGTKTLSGLATQNGVEVLLAPDEYFVMGDDRPRSSDSRAWGPVKLDLIIEIVSQE